MTGKSSRLPEKAVSKAKKVIEKKAPEVIEEVKIIQKYSYESFEKLTGSEKENIEQKVYEFFLK